MNVTKKNIGVALAAGFITLTAACGTPTDPVSVPSSGASPAPTLGEVVPGVNGAPIPAPAITAPTLASATDMDRVAADASLRDGKPYLVGLPDGGDQACHTALLVPGDPQPWIMNRPGEAVPEGTVLDRDIAQYGCSGRTTPPTGVAGRPTAPMDSAAAMARARESGAPVIYAVSSGGVSACNTVVALPSGQTWFVNRSGEARAVGDSLSDVQQLYGCRIDPSR
ncbi:hypothetical protein [Mycobacteroides abscessus]|uniref:hypothetical protein n=1 Tax=Mycobacteroides abscessus TaxID=36809 RepID=UPI000925EA3B|nr:hypothetical protein [Mycobacteroides abscessus]SIN36402.1 Uncharacterised protein [Mycobacteroides abscessus subsp. abscessus]